MGYEMAKQCIYGNIYIYTKQNKKSLEKKNHMDQHSI